MLVAGLSGFAIGQTHSNASGSMQSDKDKGWVKIGEKTVDLKDNHGIFNWNTDREKTIDANEKYSAIKFRAKDATVNLTDVEVLYADGQKKDLSINSPVRVNSESKSVLLNNDKKLDKITFNFRKDESATKDKAKLELWGLKADARSAGMGRSEATESENRTTSSVQSDKDRGWEKIGEKTVNLSENHGIFNWNTDREKTINANEKYSAIKFRAKDATVNMTDVEVQYADGQKRDLNINSPVKENGESKVISLNDNKKLDKITFNFRKDETVKAEKAMVELWGLKSTGSAMGQKNNSDVDHDSDSDHDNTSNQNRNRH